MNKFVVLLALVAAAQLSAFEGTITGKVTASVTAALEKTQISVVFDELWGHLSAEEKAVYEQRHGALPVATVRGETTPDEQGEFTLTVAFEFPKGAVPPTLVVRRGAVSVTTAYVRVWVVFHHEHFMTQWVRSSVFDGAETDRLVRSLEPRFILRGKLVHEADRKPGAGVELVLSNMNERSRWPALAQVPRLWKCTADSTGAFEFNDGYLARGTYRMVPTGGQLALAKVTDIANNILLEQPLKDLGTLLVVPGGSLKGRIDCATPERAQLSARRAGNLSERIPLGRNGEIAYEGLIPGEYALQFSVPGHWPLELTADIRPGEVADLGVVTLDPHLTVQVVAQREDGAAINAFNVRVAARSGHSETMRGWHRENTWSLTKERDTIGPLRRGNWVVIIDAPAHVRKEVEVSLPIDGPLVVKLETSGAIQVQSHVQDGHLVHPYTVWAVREDSAYGRELAAMPRQVLSQLELDEEQPDVHRTSYRASHTIDGLRPGTYVVFAEFSGPTTQFRWGVVVRKGETTRLVVQPGLPRLGVKVTRRGVPAPSERLFLAFYAHRETSQEFIECVTDSTGAFEVELRQPGACFVATAHDRSYLAQEWESSKHRRVPEPDKFWLPGVRLLAGGAADLTVELEDPSRVRAAVDVRVPEGVKIEFVELRRTLPEWQARRSFSSAGLASLAMGRDGEAYVAGSQLVDGTYLFPPVPAGTYEVVANVDSRGVPQARGAEAYSRCVEIKGPTIESIVAELMPRVLIVNLRYELPRERAIQVKLQLQHKRGANIEPLELEINENGQAVLFDPPRHEVIVVGTLWGDSKKLVAIGTRLVDPRLQTEITVLLSNSFGSIHVEMDATPALGRDFSYLQWQLKLFDKAGAEVTLADPGPGARRGGKARSIIGVPVGEYRAVVLGLGLQPAIVESVRVSQGQTTTINARPSPAGVLKVELISTEPIEFGSFSASVTFLNQAGEPVDAALPYESGDWAWVDKRVLYIYNLQPGVATVVVKFGGYEEFSVPVTVQAGVTITHKLDLKKSKD